MPLRVVIGPMFSGKTSLTIGEIGTYTSRGERVFVINHSLDTRATTKLSTHNTGFAPERLQIHLVTFVLGTHLREVMDTYRKEIAAATVVLIDEAQFFPDIHLAETLADEKIVQVTALSGSFARTQLGCVHTLFSGADEIVHLKATCSRCWREQRRAVPAPFTSRMAYSAKKESEADADSGSATDPSAHSDIFIGGSESYEPLCRPCWNAANKATASAGVEI